MVLGNLIFQTEVVEQRFTAVVLPHHDQQASDDRNQTEYGRMLYSNMLLRNLILLIDVTFSTPTPDSNSCFRVACDLGVFCSSRVRRTIPSNVLLLSLLVVAGSTLAQAEAQPNAPAQYFF